MKRTRNSTLTTETSSSRRRRRNKGLVGCLATPLIPILLLGLVYLYNNRTPNLVIPTPTLPPNNAHDDFVRAGQTAEKMRHPSPLQTGGLPPYKLADLEACANEASPILDVVRKGLVKPCVCPPTRSHKDDLTPNRRALRVLLRMIAGIAEYHQRTGNPARAMEVRLDGWEIGVMVARGGSFLEVSTAYALEEIASYKLDPLLPLLKPKELERVAQRLDHIATKGIS